jgi:hypothetical protein
MSIKSFDDECPGCRPTMIDVETGQAFADDSNEMAAVNRIWSATTLAERQAWHRFKCQNSRSIVDLQIVKTFSDRFETALLAAAGKKGWGA